MVRQRNRKREFMVYVKCDSRPVDSKHHVIASGTIAISHIWVRKGGGGRVTLDGENSIP
jgi:hypothetical protein